MNEQIIAKTLLKGSHLTSGEKHLLNWYHQMGGSFFNGLFDLMSHADEENLKKLAKSFPEDVEAFKNYKNVPGYFEALSNSELSES